MNALFYIANALVIPPAMFFAYNFYKYKAEEVQMRRLWITLGLLITTVTITSLQFFSPSVITELERNRDALLSGEIWRMVTPLFIQPGGLWQCVFNGLFFISFVPIAERLYGRGLVIIYFAAGIVGQFVNYYWETTPGGLAVGTGGSSTALYGVIGALLVYILINRKLFPKGYTLLSLAGFCGAAVLVFFEDAHAPALLSGGLLGSILSGYNQPISAYPQVQPEHR
jgi:rhomboid protease GluP